MGINKVVAKLIDKDLVARVDGTPRDHLARMINVAGINLKILPQDFRRTINREGLVIAFDPRKREKEEKLFRSDILDGVFLSGNDVNVITAEDHKFDDLPNKVGRGRSGRMTDNAIQRRLH